jgi:hypothetical protein
MPKEYGLISLSDDTLFLSGPYPQHHHVKNGAFLHFLKIQEYFLQINFNGAF